VALCKTVLNNSSVIGVHTLRIDYEYEMKHVTHKYMWGRHRVLSTLLCLSYLSYDVAFSASATCGRTVGLMVGHWLAAWTNRVTALCINNGWYYE